MAGPSPFTDIDFTLRRVFRRAYFRPYQREIITAALQGHDVFVQAATSFGKSLCYQLPATISHGITIVISPLIALVNDQVDALSRSDISAAAINSTTPFEERKEIGKDLCCGHPKTRLLYITPELLLTQSFRDVLARIHRQGELSRVAIDEAHCISEWGHDFRPAYRHLSYIRESFPDVPIMCLTATATPSVRVDILNSLQLDEAETKIFAVSTARRNLHYEVQYTSDEPRRNRFDWIVSFIKGIYARRANNETRAREIAQDPEPDRRRPDAVSGIIYVSFRNDCEALASRLRDHHIGAAPYHAGLSNLERAECQTRWLKNTPGYEIIVATTAFGMGIDKQDVRFVIHWTLPKSFEGYYQEAGRAGRDGNAALCLLFYSREDRDRVRNRLERDLIQNQNQNMGNRGAAAGGSGGVVTTDVTSSPEEARQARLAGFQELAKYCEQTDTCRHVAIGKFFGGGADENVVGEGTTANPGVLQVCDRACDVCFTRPGETALKRRKERDLASEEWVSTQRESEGFWEAR